MKSTKHLSSPVLNHRFGNSFQTSFLTELQNEYHNHEYHELIIDEISESILKYNFPVLLKDANTKKPVHLYLFNLQTAIFNLRSHRCIQVREFVLGDRTIKKTSNNWVKNPHLSIYERQRKIVINLLSDKECWIFIHLTVLN